MKKVFFFLVFLLTISFFSFSEQYHILDFNFNISGATKNSLIKTKDTSLLIQYPIDTNTIFTTQEEFEKYLENYEQTLINSRAFENVEILYESDLSTSDSSITNVILTINLQDSHHLLILPYPKYDSNSGVTLKIKVKDTNFLGSLKTFNLDLNTNYYDGDLSAGLNFSYDQPFKAGPFNIYWVNDYSFDFIIGKKIPEFSAKTGLEVTLPKNRYSYVLEFFQYAYKDYDYEIYGDDLYFKEEIKFSVPFKLYSFKNYSNLLYTPYVKFSFNWDFDSIQIENNDLSSPYLDIGHSISNEKINWNNNFRKGYSACLSNNYTYNFQRHDFYSNLVFEFQFFNNFKAYEERNYFDRFGFYSRMKIFTTFEISSNKFKYGQEIGDWLRGIKDSTCIDLSSSVPSAIVLNIDLPHHIFTTNFKKDIINFDLQISPFLDIALIQSRKNNKVFSLADGLYCAGVEFLVFPKKWSSYTIRASAGFDLKESLNSTRIIKGLLHNYEIYIGLGTAY